MVGEGILLQCLASPAIEQILVINRRPCGIAHPRLREIIHEDMFDISSLAESLAGYEGCLFCLGISSVGVKKEYYFKVTYTLTMAFATSLFRVNPSIRFCYVSGAGTDSSGKSRPNWARVKGKTENDLFSLGPGTFAFRPGFIKPLPGQRNVKSYYRYILWMFPLGRKLYRNGFCTVSELGNAMIHVTANGYGNRILEGEDIIRLGRS